MTCEAASDLEVMSAKSLRPSTSWIAPILGTVAVLTILLTGSVVMTLVLAGLTLLADTIVRDRESANTASPARTQPR